MEIEVVFLGTGQAVPTIKRNHTAILVKYNGENMLFDCGEGTQTQFRKAQLNPCKLTKIFISHWHGDHILGLPGLFQTLALNGYSRTLEIYGPLGTKRYLSSILNMFIFAGKLNVNIHEVKEETLKFKDFNVNAIRLEHGCPCLGYRFEEKDKIRIDKSKLKKFGLKEGPVIGKLKELGKMKAGSKTIKLSDISYIEKGKSIGIIMDTKINNSCYKIAKDADLLICESTFLDELRERAIETNHLTNVQSAEIAKKAKAKKLALTHISQRHELDDKKMLSGAKKVFKNTILAEDLMRIKI